MDYKSVFTNLCLELQQNRSWIKGLGKNPQKSELIHWRQCLLSGGTEVCSLGLRETPACIHVIQRLSQPRVACWHGFRQNSKKTECVFTRCPTGGRKKKFCVYTASEAKGLTNHGQVFVNILIINNLYVNSWLRNLKQLNIDSSCPCWYETNYSPGVVCTNCPGGGAKSQTAIGQESYIMYMYIQEYRITKMQSVGGDYTNHNNQSQ